MVFLGPSRSLGVFVLVSLAAVPSRWAFQDVTINTGLIRGFAETVDGKRVDKFLGIPFAKPPLGDLRFAKPQPAENWTSTKDTIAYGDSCMQIPNTYGFPNPVKISEDCLTLNVFAPDTNMTKAVMVYVHGGGYYFGGSFHYDFTEFAARSNVIVVSVNYRLGAFGFLSIDPPLGPANLGLWDQIEGLKWVKNNIRFFHGDPDRVTIFGESAGGGSVAQLAVTVAARGLFHRFIPQSGSAWADWAFSPFSAELSLKIGKKVGCNYGPTERSKLLSCLRTTDAETYLKAADESDDGLPGIIFYAPEIDGDMFPRSLSEEFGNPESGVVQHFRSLDYMGGFNDGDGVILTPPELYNGTTPVELRDKWIPKMAKEVSPNQEGDDARVADAMTEVYFNKNADKISTARSYADILTDWIFSGGVGLMTDAHATPDSGSTYLYYFTKVPSFGYVISPVPSWFQRANHADDLSFLLGSHHPSMVPNATFTDDEKEFSKQMMTYWANFAKTGNPNSPDSVPVNWPQYTAKGKEYIELGDVTKVKSDVIPKRMELWVKTIPDIVASAMNNANHEIRGSMHMVHTIVVISLVRIFN